MLGRRRQRGRRTWETFQLRERLIDVGDDYWIETDRGRRAFKVNGKVLRVRDTFVLEDPHGDDRVRMKHHPVRVRDTWAIERPGLPEAKLHKALVSPLRHRWVIEADDIGQWHCQGNIVDHEYTIEDDDGHEIAEISKRWLRVRDSYGVQVDPAVDIALVLATTVAIDRADHD